MDPIVVEAVKTVFLEGIKILGPAIVTGLLTYKATKSQLEGKLHELERTHAFGANEHWFNYYKSRQESLAQENERLNEGLGQILGMASAFEEGSKQVASPMMVTLAETVLTFSRLTCSEIETTARDLEEQGFSISSDHQRLLDYLTAVRQVETEFSFASLKRNLFLLLEVHQFLQRCNDFLLKQQMNRSLRGYTDA